MIQGLRWQRCPLGVVVSTRGTRVCWILGRVSHPLSDFKQSTSNLSPNLGLHLSGEAETEAEAMTNFGGLGSLAGLAVRAKEVLTSDANYIQPMAWELQARNDLGVSLSQFRFAVALALAVAAGAGMRLIHSPLSKTSVPLP